MLLFGLDRFPFSRLAEVASERATALPSSFFLYGLSATDPAQPAATTMAAGSFSLRNILSGVAALPQKSPDERLIALVSIGENGVPTVAVTCIDAATGDAVTSGVLDLPDVSLDTSVLVTPAFAADSKTLCLVLSLTVPTNRKVIEKVDQDTGSAIQRDAATWVSRHAIAYFDATTGVFAGPFDLADGPSLARVNVAANATDLFLWSMDYPIPEWAALATAKPETDFVPPEPRLAAYPLGAGKARFAVDAQGPWPVNGEPLLPLPTGNILRLVYGTTLETWSPKDGAVSRVLLPALDRVKAKSSAPTMQLRRDGQLFVSAPSLATALLVDPSRDYAVAHQLDYSEPLYSRGGPAEKAVLSDDGATLVVLGDRMDGGLASFDFTTGKQVGAYSDGLHFNAVHRLASGNLLAIEPLVPSLYLLSPDLELFESTSCDIHVAAVL